MYKCAAQARARKKKENVYAASVECTLMDTTRLSQRRPRRPLLAQHLSCHYPRPVGSRTRPMVPFRAKGRVEVASSLSLLHRSIGEPSPPLPPLIPPIPLCSSSYNPSPPPPPRYTMRPMAGLGFPHRTPRHLSSRVVGFIREEKKALGLLPQKGLDVRPEVEVGVIWILVDCGKARGQLPACPPAGGDRKQLTSSALCRRRRGGLLGLGVRLLGLGDQLLLVLVLVLGGGRALRRRDCPLVVEAVEDAEAEGRVSEDLEAGRGEAGVSWVGLGLGASFSTGPGGAEVRCGGDGDGGTHVDSGCGRHFDQAGYCRNAPIASCSRGQDGVPAVNWGGCGRREANWSVGACRGRDGEVVGWSGGLSSAGGLRGKVGRFWAKLGCFRGFFSRGTHAPPPLWLSLGGPPAAAAHCCH